MDRNKDGFITKGELKLAKKNVGMSEIDSVIKKYDIDKDGKLNMDEFEKSADNWATAAENGPTSHGRFFFHWFTTLH